MTNEQELKTMIKCFRVVDLQVLLSFAGRSKVGKKQELQERALDLLQLKSQPLALKIRHLYDSMQKGYVKNRCNVTNFEVNDAPSLVTDRGDGGGLQERVDEIPIIDVNECQLKIPLNLKETNSSFESKELYQACPVQPNSSSQFSHNSMYLPIHPDVKFKKLPFYEILCELLRPCSLVPQGYDCHQRNSFMFYITPQQATAIYHSRDLRPDSQNEFKVQGQLRFCLLETTSPQNDAFPAGLKVKVNNKFCDIQKPPMKKNKDKYVRGISPPINITPLMRLNASEGNQVEVQWNTEYGVTYVVAVYLVQKKSSKDLITNLKAKGVRSSNYTKGMIKDKLNEEADGEILTTSLRVSLNCPLGKMRLITPCRASTCKHLQCFDASLYIQMNEKKTTWMCPVCDNPAEYDQLIIDGYFQEILASDKLKENVNEIELHSDGSWSSHVIKSEDNSSGDGSVFVIVETKKILDVIIEESKCEETSKIRTNVESEKKIRVKNDDRQTTESEKRKVYEIDLTVSDSDDELLMYIKRKKTKRKSMFQSNSNSNHSNSNSNPSFPSVINLDSDSSDSLPLIMWNGWR